MFSNPLFIDIETVSSVADYHDLSEGMQALWCKKAKSLGYDNLPDQIAAFSERAGIYAEFGQVVVIVVGYLGKKRDQDSPGLHIAALSGHNEKALLERFVALLGRFPDSLHFCGHNIKEFDLPYLCRRMVVHGVSLPPPLDIQGKKPWEILHEDTMEMWKFGDRKSYTSLDLLAHTLSLPSSKSDMSGDQVGHYYYQKKDLDAIARYCVKDVVVTAQVYRRMRLLPLIDDASIHTKHIFLSDEK